VKLNAKENEDRKDAGEVPIDKGKHYYWAGGGGVEFGTKLWKPEYLFSVLQDWRKMFRILF
jgi:hypothetical protein